MKLTEHTARFVLAAGTLLIVGATVAGLFLREIPSVNRDLAIALTSALVGAFVASMNFYNKTGLDNDRKKDKTIAVLAEKAPSHTSAKPTEPPA